MKYILFLTFLVHNIILETSQAMIYPEQIYLQTEIGRLKCTKHLVRPGRENAWPVIYKKEI